MQKIKLEKIDDLADVFCAVMGGYPDNIREIEAFMEQSNLNKLIYATDMERIIKYDGFFADETIDAVYALLPVKLPLGNEKSLVLTPQFFRKLNARKVSKPASRLINISFPKAMTIYSIHYGEKVKSVIEAINEIQQKQRLQELAKSEAEGTEKGRQEAEQKETPQEIRKKQEEENLRRKKEELEPALKELQRRRAEREQKEAQKKKDNKELLEKEREKNEKEKRRLERSKRNKRKQLAEINPQLAVRREKNRLRMQKIRAENPEARKSYYKKYEDLSEEEREERRQANRERNRKYREAHRLELRKSQSDRRLKIKAENPEAIKERDKKNNLQANRKEINQRYYQKHKEELKQKAKENPMTKIYKQRYKDKKRSRAGNPAISELIQKAKQKNSEL